ncbi:MAG: DUF3592 domain-containing protein [Candidatus Electrothrix sp. AR1]|nr:DUF3592 domain-containing protein [Candidatus Electrothrix sp. AR1]
MLSPAAHRCFETSCPVLSVKSALKTLLLITVIWMTVPIGCSFGGAYWLYTRYDWKKHSVQVEGRVVEQVEVRGEDGIMWQPVVEYVYRDKTERYVSGVKSSPKPYKDGAKVNVLIGSDDDSTVRLDRFAELYLCPLVLCAVSIPFMTIGLIVVIVCIVLVRRSSKKFDSERSAAEERS